jgi:hypothetical protein
MNTLTIAGLLVIVLVLGIMLPQTYAQSDVPEHSKNCDQDAGSTRDCQATSGNPSNPQLPPTIGREFGSCVASGFNEANPNCP